MPGARNSGLYFHFDLHRQQRSAAIISHGYSHSRTLKLLVSSLRLCLPRLLTLVLHRRLHHERNDPLAGRAATHHLRYQPHYSIA